MSRTETPPQASTVETRTHPPSVASAPAARTRSPRMPLWALVTSLLAVVAAVLAGLIVFGSATLPERTGPPVEDVAVERTVLRPGVITLTIRNVGPDPVQIAQVAVNDSYANFAGGDAPIQRLQSEALDVTYDWQSGQPYSVALLTSTGLVIEHQIPAAVLTPAPGPGLFIVMALLGTYVGIIPVALGMLMLPLLRRAGPHVMTLLLAVTVGLLAFLAVDAAIEGLALAASSGGAFGGATLVILGAGLAYLALTAVNRLLDRRTRGDEATPPGWRLAAMIAVGIGLHNLGEGLAIGSAYAIGELALGAALVAGFALHNTTEGLAVVAPLTGRRPRILPLLGLGLIAGAPAILGAVVGAGVNNAAVSATLFGVGVGAIIQVIVQISPALRGREGPRRLSALVLGGIALGIVVMYLTGLLIAG